MQLKAGRGTFSMTEGKIGRQLMMFALPIMASNLFQQVYNMVDTAVVGRFVGDEALAAVGSVGSLIFLISGFFMGIGAGAGVVVSHYFGARDREMLSKTVHTAVLTSLIIGVIITVLGLVACPFILRAMGFPPEVAVLSELYLRIFFGGITPMVLYNICAGMIRSVGDSRRPLYYLVISGMINVALNLLFVVVFAWGVAGVAAATVISQTFAAALTLMRLLRAYGEDYRLEWRKLRLHRDVLRRIIRIGVPTGAQTLFFSIPNLYLQTSINTFGAIAMAGCAAYAKVDGFLYMLVNGLSVAVTTFVGQNAGAGQVDRIRKGAKTGLAIGFGMMVVAGGLVQLFAHQILWIFSDSEEAIAYGINMMHYMAPLYFLFAMSEVLSGLVRGVGQAAQAMTITAVGICVVRVIWLYFGMDYWSDIWVVFAAYPISWFCCLTGFALYYRAGRWTRAVHA